MLAYEDELAKLQTIGQASDFTTGSSSSLGAVTGNLISSNRTAAVLTPAQQQAIGQRRLVGDFTHGAFKLMLGLQRFPGARNRGIACEDCFVRCGSKEVNENDAHSVRSFHDSLASP